MGARPENARQRAARFRRYRSVSGTVTVGMLLELPQTLNRDRLIEKIIGAAEGTPGWVLDACAEAEEHRRTAARDREPRPARRWADTERGTGLCGSHSLGVPRSVCRGRPRQGALTDVRDIWLSP